MFIFFFKFWADRPPPPPLVEGAALNEIRGRILGRNQTKVLRVFILAIHRHLYSFAFTQPLTVSTFHLLCTVKEKGEKNLIENHTTFNMI